MNVRWFNESYIVNDLGIFVFYYNVVGVEFCSELVLRYVVVRLKSDEVW